MCINRQLCTTLQLEGVYLAEAESNRREIVCASFGDCIYQSGRSCPTPTFRTDAGDSLDSRSGSSVRKLPSRLIRE